MDLMDLVAVRVIIEHEGCWEESNIKIVESEEFTPLITEEMRIVAAERFAARKAKNPKLYDGPAYHLDLKYSLIVPWFIALAVSRMTYSIYDIARKELQEKYGWQTIPTGMGTIAAIITSDLKIIMHRRSPSVDLAAKIGTIGGVYIGGEPFADIQREILEELAIEKRELTTLLLLGIYTRLDERLNHGLSFFAKTALSSEEVLRREKTLTEKEGEIFFLEAKEETVKVYLEKNHPDITSDSFASLVLAGRHLWKHK